MAITEETRKEKAPRHQPGQSAFKAILNEVIDWKPFAAFPPSVRLAVLVGEPSQPGPYVIRVRVPCGVKPEPHKHSEDRIYTVIAGVFYIGIGDEFDADKLEAYPPGTVIILPGNTSHFPASTSRRYQRSVHSAWNTSDRKMIRGIRVPCRHPEQIVVICKSISASILRSFLIGCFGQVRNIKRCEGIVDTIV